MQFHVFEPTVIRPFAWCGLTGNFWAVNIETLCYTWVAMGLLALVVLGVRRVIANRTSPLAHGIMLGTRFFYGLVEDAMGSFDEGVFSFIFGIVLFTLMCNWAGVLPYVGEATADLNTALAIGMSAFFYVQYTSLRIKGWGYFKKYTKPFFLFFPVNVIGQLAKLTSLTFRLFGNILGGAVILTLLINLYQSAKVPFIALAAGALATSWVLDRSGLGTRYPWLGKLVGAVLVIVNIVPGFQCVEGLGVGAMQAFVIGLLTSMYLSSEFSDSKPQTESAAS